MSKGSKDLYTILDGASNQLRSKMDASEYKAYLLGIIFYKYLSDQMLDYVFELKNDSDFDTFDQTNRLSFYRGIYNSDEYHEDIVYDIKESFQYVIEPDHTFDAMLNSILGLSGESFQLELLSQGLRNIEQSNKKFEDLFSDVDLNSRRLGSTRSKQSQTIANTIQALADVNFGKYSGDVLGDAYEHMIRQFAMNAGHRAGEFYTPHEVSDLLSQIVMQGVNRVKKGFTVYDPTSGSGSLLLNVKNYSDEPDFINYFGQELNTTTYNLARMNMLLHGVSVNRYTLSNGDTLDEDWPQDEPTDFDGVLMNPPYSARWSRDPGFMDDARFSSYGKLAPKAKADYAFLLHGYYHLKNSGTMAIVLPHGVLFRGNAEGTIRENLLKQGAIEAVIGLPGGIFYNTPIPTVVLILKKDRIDRDVLFIDGSELYDKQSAQNVLLDEHVSDIFDAYLNRKYVDKFAYLASFDEIKENDFNLNIPRYVDTFEEEEPIDLNDVSSMLIKLDAEIDAKEKELVDMLLDMQGTTDNADKEFQMFVMNILNGVK